MVAWKSPDQKRINPGLPDTSSFAFLDLLVTKNKTDTVQISDEAVKASEQMNAQCVELAMHKVVIDSSASLAELGKRLEDDNKRMLADFIRIHRAHRRAAFIKRWLPNIAGTVLIITGLVIYMVGSGYIPW